MKVVIQLCFVCFCSHMDHIALKTWVINSHRREMAIGGELNANPPNWPLHQLGEANCRAWVLIQSKLEWCINDHKCKCLCSTNRQQAQGSKNEGSRSALELPTWVPHSISPDSWRTSPTERESMQPMRDKCAKWV